MDKTAKKHDFSYSHYPINLIESSLLFPEMRSKSGSRIPMIFGRSAPLLLGLAIHSSESSKNSKSTLDTEDMSPSPSLPLLLRLLSLPPSPSIAAVALALVLVAFCSRVLTFSLYVIVKAAFVHHVIT